MAMKLFDSELKVMEVLWRNGDTTAKRLAEILAGQTGWSKTTTYTVIKRCLDKGAIERRDPNWICHPLVTIEDAREYETNELIDKMWGGAADQLVASILGRRDLSKEEIERLKQVVREME
uniref:Beta-lactamase repressor BlaI n=1 Tax=uncultured bacterium contig00005 TaxID=1181497 RepID=A0A806JZD7_9BACT|nr:beta-lactamase repressor BlaI [uncultured bacterium contig00005]